MLLDLILLAGGLVVIFYGGRYLIEGASSLALRFGMPPVVIGVTIVALGTSAPELFLSVMSAAEGVPGVSIGNVIGANVANVTLVLGTCAVIAPIISRFEEVRRESYVAVMAGLLFLLFAIDRRIEAWEGAIMLVIFIAYMYWVLRTMRTCCVPKEVDSEYEDLTKERPLWRSIAYLGIGIAALAIGSQLTIDGAVAIAESIGLSNIVIGATIVSFGTVLPELTVSVIAAMKRQQDIAIGNVLGTVIFNTLVVAGAASMISELTFPGTTVFPGLIFIIGLCLFLTFILRRRSGVPRGAGYVLLALYAIFIGVILALSA